jgi:hypothetical protein
VFLFATDLVRTDAAHTTPQWTAARVEHYRSMLTAVRYWSEALKRAFRGLALPETARHSSICANVDAPSPDSSPAKR